MLPKHNAEGPEHTAGEVQVDQAREGGRDVGTMVSEWETRSVGAPQGGVPTATHFQLPPELQAVGDVLVLVHDRKHLSKIVKYENSTKNTKCIVEIRRYS